jgi:hypothetical protein
MIATGAVKTLERSVESDDDAAIHKRHITVTVFRPTCTMPRLGLLQNFVPTMNFGLQFQNDLHYNKVK